MAIVDSHTPTPSTPPTPAPSSTPPQLVMAEIAAATQPSFFSKADARAFSATRPDIFAIKDWRPGNRMMFALRQRIGKHGKELTPTARIVLAAIAFHGWLSWPTQQRLADLLNIRKNHVSRAIAELVAAGLLWVSKAYGRKGNAAAELQYGIFGGELVAPAVNDPAIIARITRQPAPEITESQSAIPPEITESQFGIPQRNPSEITESQIGIPQRNPSTSHPESVTESQFGIPPENHGIPNWDSVNIYIEPEDEDEDIDLHHHHLDSGSGTRDPRQNSEKKSDFPPPDFSEFPPPPPNVDPADYYAALTIAKGQTPDMTPGDVAAALDKLAARNKARPRDPVASLKGWLPGRIAECNAARKNDKRTHDREYRRRMQERRGEDTPRPPRPPMPTDWTQEWKDWDVANRNNPPGNPPPRPPEGNPPVIIKRDVANARQYYWIVDAPGYKTVDAPGDC